MTLAGAEDNTLAGELAMPVWAILEQIEDTAMHFQRRLMHKQVKDAADQAECERILDQLDFALALILRRVPSAAKFRGQRSKNPDLLCEAASLVVGDGAEAARQIQRYMKVVREDGRNEDGTMQPDSFPDHFAWDTYQRVEALDRLADEFPEHVRTAARNMHGWPMLMHRHTNNRARFQELADRLELGTDYPLDASAAAKYRPDTPMVRYLDPLICHLNYVRMMMVDKDYPSPEEERRAVRDWWWDGEQAKPADAMVDALLPLRHLPLLTKATARRGRRR